MKQRQFRCDICDGMFNHVGPGRPRRYCDSCKERGVSKPAIAIEPEEVSGKNDRKNTSGIHAQLDLALGIVRAVASGRPCHQEAIAVLRKIEG